jgi:hypothetical protein
MAVIPEAAERLSGTLGSRCSRVRADVALQFHDQA